LLFAPGLPLKWTLEIPSEAGAGSIGFPLAKRTYFQDHYNGARLFLQKSKTKIYLDCLCSPFLM